MVAVQDHRQREKMMSPNSAILVAFVLAVLVFVIPKAAQAQTEVGINCMSVGGKTLEVVDNRQLTLKADGQCMQVWISPNGKYAACLFDSGYQLQIIEINTYRNVLTLNRHQYDDAAGKVKLTAPVWTLPRPLGIEDFAWLLDSKAFIMHANRLVPNDELGMQWENYIVKMTIKGDVTASYQIPKNTLWNGIRLNPDGVRVAFDLLDLEPSPSCRIIVWNTKIGTSETVVSRDEHFLNLQGWTYTGNGLLYTTKESGSDRKTIEINLSNKNTKMIVMSKLPYLDSPDGTFAVEEHASNIRILTRATDQVARAINSPNLQFDKWLHNSKMFTYDTSTMINDETKTRESGIWQIWLATLENNKLNHMCVAVHADIGTGQTWSTDLTRMGYTSEGQAYIAELKWREPNSAEKIALGLPLGEEEEKTILQTNAKHIGLAFALYAGDHDGAYPPADKVREELYPHMKRPDLFLRPETKQDIFTYNPQTRERDVEFPADTVIGTLDAGYDWVVDIYVDGHVRTRQKDHTTSTDKSISN